VGAYDVASRCRGECQLYAPFDLTGKTCLVTGGSRGIGFGIADALHQAGANVVIWSWDPKKGLSAAHELSRHGANVHAQQIDVRSRDSVDLGFEELLGTFPVLDAVIACAGTPQRLAKLQDTSEELVREMLSVHLEGTFWTVQAACRQFQRQAEEGRPGGSIVGCSSLTERFGAPLLYAYSAAKGAISSLMASVAIEMAKYGVRSNTIVPGWIETDLSRALRDRVGDEAMRRIPARRWGRPEDLGGIAVYLASDASAYHTGDTIVIDGGYSIA
jgi:NAD(P)-dependent dehydrogenase (short-subunit alcohol dehydrogenase family)